MKYVINYIKNLSKIGEFPNIETPTMGGEVFWDTIDEIDGWKVQVNVFTKHARILDNNNVRKAWGKESVMLEKLKRIKANSFLKVGDIIGVSRLLYEHYAVYVGNNKVIHYAGDTAEITKHATIQYGSMEDFLQGASDYFVLDFNEIDKEINKVKCNNDFFKTLFTLGDEEIIANFKDFHLYSPEETVARAEKRIGEEHYNLVTNNCEHFAIWCKTGCSVSYQVNKRISQIFDIFAKQIYPIKNI